MNDRFRATSAYALGKVVAISRLDGQAAGTQKEEMFDASRRKRTLEEKRLLLSSSQHPPSSTDRSITTERAVSATDMLGVSEVKGQDTTFPVHGRLRTFNFLLDCSTAARMLGPRVTVNPGR